MATLHRESGLPYAVWKGLQNQERAASWKRKANPTPPAASRSSRTKLQNPISDLSPDAKQLFQIVTKSHEPALRLALSRSILSATPSDLVAYKKFLGSLVTAAQNPLHCVRCHASYVEHENNTRSCKIPHDEPEYIGDDVSDDYLNSDPESCDSRGDEQPLVRYPCCGRRMGEDDADYNREMCIGLMHTTDPTRVDYYIDPNSTSEKKKKQKIEYYWRDYYKYTNTNPHVVTCKEKKCPGA
ncbi:hypothetical protein FRC06_008962 [Ceratobasidium sp. 370]|nr:hypothetical protein FRC06_008962 [Ceratobasidium sp. 370]